MSGAAQKPYVLGSDPAELTRLDRQAAVIDRATRLLLNAAGIGRGQRVLVLGTGLGHVARIAGELVGSEGAVVGLDQSIDALAVARQRANDEGVAHVSFVDGDVRTWVAPEPFDTIVGRLLLFHMADPLAVVGHHLGNLRPGGLFVALDYDLGGCRTEPPVAVAEDCLRWVRDAFIAAGASPRIGARVALILREAGLDNVTTFGVQEYFAPESPAGPAMLAAVVRSLATPIVQHGIATADQLDLPTLQQRIADAMARASAVLLPPTLVGAWGRTAADVRRG
jgi:ubiquinone/menaquinone biosynthesis C-methylase UbiE